MVVIAMTLVIPLRMHSRVQLAHLAEGTVVEWRQHERGQLRIRAFAFLLAAKKSHNRKMANTAVPYFESLSRAPCGQLYFEFGLHFPSIAGGADRRRGSPAMCSCHPITCGLPFQPNVPAGPQRQPLKPLDDSPPSHAHQLVMQYGCRMINPLVVICSSEKWRTPCLSSV